MKPKISKRWPKREVETFFDSWNPKMAYILGYFAADGSMYKNPRGGHYISFTSTDLELIQTVKSILKVTNNIEVYQSKHINWKPRYTLQIGSRIVFRKLIKIGLTPVKSFNLVFPAIPSNLINHFIRGYFDGDGCAGFYKVRRKGRKKKYLFLTIQFRCGSKNFLETIKQHLFTLKRISRGVLSFHSGAYSLAYIGPSVVELYRFLYPEIDIPCLKRKRSILRNGILEKYGIEV